MSARTIVFAFQSDTSGFASGITAMSTGFLALRQLASSTFRSLSAGLQGTVGKYAEFDRVNRLVGAQFGKSADQIKDIANGFTQIGIETQFTTDEIQRAGLALAQMGSTEAELLPLLRTAANVATVTGTDLVLSAKTAKSMMNQFGIEAKDSARMTTLLTEAATGSAADIADLGLAMRGTGAIASLMNQNVEDVSAIVARLKDVGTHSGTAGRAMRKFFTILAGGPMSTEQAAWLTKLGAMDPKIGKITPEFDLKDNSAIEVLERLRDAGMDAEHAMYIFGKEFGPTIAGLVQVDKKGDDALQKIKAFRTQFQDGASASNKLATAQSGLAYEMEQVGGTFDAAQTKIGELITKSAGLEPVMVRIRESVAGVAEAISAIKPGQLQDITARIFNAGTLTSVFDSAINNILPAMGRVVGSAFMFGVQTLARFTPLIGVSLAKATLGLLESGFITIAELAGKAISNAIESTLLLTVGAMTKALSASAGVFSSSLATKIEAAGDRLLGEIKTKGEEHRTEVGKGANDLRNLATTHGIGSWNIDSAAQVKNGDDLVKMLGLDKLDSVMDSVGGLGAAAQASFESQQKRIADQKQAEADAAAAAARAQFEASRKAAAAPYESQGAAASAQAFAAAQEAAMNQLRQGQLAAHAAALQRDAANGPALGAQLSEYDRLSNILSGAGYGRSQDEMEQMRGDRARLFGSLKQAGGYSAAQARIAGLGQNPQQQARTMADLQASISKLSAAVQQLGETQRSAAVIDQRVQTIYAAATPEDLARVVGEPSAVGGGMASGGAR